MSRFEAKIEAGETLTFPDVLDAGRRPGPVPVGRFR